MKPFCKKCGLIYNCGCPSPMQRLAALGDWLLEQTQDSDYPEYDEIIDKAVDLGILEAHEVNEPCSDTCPCADAGFPATCYRRTDEP